jgi:lecithin:retinol acyltransferase
MVAGDHLFVKRKRWFLIYYHHGIFAGDGKVIHLTGPRKKDAKVIETSLEEFLNDGVKEVWEYAAFIDILC